MNIALFLAFCLLNLADAALTARILAAGGSEANGFMAAAMRRLGVWPAMLITKTVAALVAWVIIVPHPHGAPVLSGLVALYVWVVWHNVGVLRRQQIPASAR
jgi:hypothetical protein